jgi:hypothetical protein
MGVAAQPRIELARKRRRGDWRIYFGLYRRPFRVHVLGAWIVGRPW